MPAPVTTDDFLELARQSGILDAKELEAYLRTRGEPLPASPAELAVAMVNDGVLTRFQAGQFLKGKWRGFLIAGKYKLLEHLGSGGMASVFLCEHVSMHRRVALKVLPVRDANDPAAVERFHREARAVATLDHPNVVRAHDIDRDGNVHFLVMEYVDGSSLQDIVGKRGPLSIERATHYIRQAAIGLDAADRVGLVHRDIKPSNILVDRSGTVKILDMGLARFFRDDGDDLTKKYDEDCVLGTADYCAPEQVMNSHGVDIRADIYSLGATFYFCLTGRTPFGPGTTAQKIIWHQMKEPTPVRELRPEVPEELAAVQAKMMAKAVEERYQTPVEVDEALARFDTEDIPPPPDDEMPRLCPRSQGPGSDPSTVRRHRSSTTTTKVRRISVPSAEETPTVITARPVVPAPAAKPPRVPRAAIWAAAGVGGLLLIVVAVVLTGWALRDKSPPVRAIPPRGADVGREPSTEGVAITSEKSGRRVRTPNYEALIAEDGNMASLKVGGVEYFKPGVKFGNAQQSRGASLFAEDGRRVLSLSTIEQAGSDIRARGESAEIRYSFGPSSLTWAVSNHSSGEQRLCIVFGRAVQAVTDSKGFWAEVPARLLDNSPVEHPVAHDWPTTSWFAGPSRLTLEGGTRTSGLWPTPQENYQIWQLTVPPHETREATASAGAATAEELAHVATVTAAAPTQQAGGVIITHDRAGRHARAPRYEALVENDGSVSSLKVGGVELLESHVSVSRGSYFFRQDKGRPLPMNAIEQPLENVITATGELCSVRYEFGTDGLVWTLSNNSDKDEHFFIIFSPAITAVTNGEQTIKTPTSQTWPSAIWHFGSGRLEITGGSFLWGPWPSAKENRQAWDALLAPHETRRVTMQVLESQPEATGIILQSPRNYQVFQRHSRQKGEVAVRGTAPAQCDAVEARLTGSSLDGPLPDRWQPVPLTADRHNFAATLATTPGGWYRLEVRAVHDGKPVAVGAVDHVGVGEVFVIAGQSNSTNSGEKRQRPVSGMVASFSGDSWQPADDPQPGTQDGSVGGSPWPAFGDALFAHYKVPIAIASTGSGGSSTAEWKEGSDLFTGLARRMAALGPHGFRAILWHQGEADFDTPGDEYARRMAEIIKASRKAAGWDVTWFVAHASYQSPAAAQSIATRAGQKKLWETKVALEGPDTDALIGDNRDQGGKGIHFSDKGLRAHGQLWADKVIPVLDKVLSE
jgi:serine/threonine protein kinase